MEEMIGNAEEFYQSLGIPYCVVNIVSGREVRDTCTCRETERELHWKNWRLILSKMGHLSCRILANTASRIFTV